MNKIQNMMLNKEGTYHNIFIHNKDYIKKDQLNFKINVMIEVNKNSSFNKKIKTMRLDQGESTQFLNIK